METVTIQNKYAHIKGWGVDANPQNEPTYPMKKYTGDDHKRLDYQKPPQQNSDIEVLHSIERPSISAVYGTTVPPSGLSGIIRRFAFKYSEGSFGHWLPLILADKINVYEGIVSDVFRGKVPNVFAERGWKADWKYNRKATIRKVVVQLAIASAVIAYLALKDKKIVKKSLF